jgi:hypothetical protein
MLHELLIGMNSKNIMFLKLEKKKRKSSRTHEMIAYYNANLLENF